ncbi:unnamed protein product, partial [Amoebophrya sp. A25]
GKVASPLPVDFSLLDVAGPRKGSEMRCDELSRDRTRRGILRSSHVKRSSCSRKKRHLDGRETTRGNIAITRSERDSVDAVASEWNDNKWPRCCRNQIT